MAQLCKTFRCLPRPGGLLDQDWYHVELIKIGLQAMAEREQRDMDKKMKAQH